MKSHFAKRQLEVGLKTSIGGCAGIHNAGSLCHGLFVGG